MDATERQGWQDSKYEDLEAVMRRMREIPHVRAALATPAVGSPKMSLQCTRGHHLVTIQLEEDWRGDLYISQAGQPLIARRDVVARAVGPGDTRHGARNRVVVCAEPGCPALVASGNATCETHGALASNELDKLRVQFVCTECTGKSGTGKVRPMTVTQSRLLQMYCTALVRGLEAIRITS